MIKRIWIIALAAALATGMLAGCSSEKSEATAAYKEAAAAVEQMNTEADEAIAALQALIDSDEDPLDTATIDAADKAIGQMQGDKVEVPEVPSDLEDIKAGTAQLEAVDYSTDMAAIEKASKNLSNSIEQMKLVTNPSEAEVIKRVKTVKHVTAAKAVTEDNDPNGQLGKQGGYTATVYFSSDWVNQSEVYGKDLIDKGTDAGGAVEVYANAEDAQKRSDYLGAFDGGMFSSGSHEVYGTCVIRTSDNLPASKQKKLTQAVLKALTKLD